VPSGDRRAALGISPHTGWAAVVAVSGSRLAPTVVAKHRIDMATTFEKGAVYHAGQALPLIRAEALIRTSEQTFTSLARDSLAGLAAELRGRGLEPIASAILAGGDRPLPPLEKILRSHALVHAAEGDLYRRVLALASEACAIPAALVSARDLRRRVAGASGLPEDRVDALLAELGKASGKPWARDQREAALAGWLALAADHR
jgi:hypothetical protein